MLRKWRQMTPGPIATFPVSLHPTRTWKNTAPVNWTAVSTSNNTSIGSLSDDGIASAALASSDPARSHEQATSGRSDKGARRSVLDRLRHRT